jgi:hypothetical protein
MARKGNKWQCKPTLIHFVSIFNARYRWIAHNASFDFLDRPPTLHPVKFTFETGFELSSSWTALPRYFIFEVASN